MEGFQEDYDLIKRRNYQIIKSNKLVQKTRYTLSLQQQITQNSSFHYSKGSTGGQKFSNI